MKKILIKYIGNNSNIPDFSVYPECTISSLLNYFKDNEVTYIELDTETFGLDFNTDKLISVQIGHCDNQWVFDCRFNDIKILKPILENNNIVKILHNAKFDYKFLKAAGINIENVWDTMLMEQVIHCGEHKPKLQLSELINNYLGITIEKDTRKTFSKLSSEPLNCQQIKYAGTDVMYLHKIVKFQYNILSRLDLLYAAEIENKVVLAIGDMEYNGVYLNREKWVQNYNKNQRKLIDIEIEMDKYILQNSKTKQYFGNQIQTNLLEQFFGEETRKLSINYGSPLQIKKLAYKLGFILDNVDDRQIQKIKNIEPFFKLLESHREISKAISTYGLKFLENINKKTNRIHTNFWQILNTYRLSSNEPNMQNIPKPNEYRNAFEAREGYDWVSIDYSSQELNLMADFSGEEAFIEVLNNKEDLHCFVGSIMFQRTITKEDKDLRQKAKTINFGKPYGMSYHKLAEQLNIDTDEAQELFDVYASKFPKLENWLNKQYNFGIKNKYIRLNSLHKGIRWFSDEYKIMKNNPYEAGKYNGIIGRASMNTPIQGTGAIIVKEALIELRKLIIENKYDGIIILQVHDEINFEINSKQTKEFIKEAEKIMCEVGNKYVSKVKMGVETSINKYWYK